MKAIPKTDCECCEGTGLTINHTEVGRVLRKRREGVGMSLRTLAAILGVSAPYLSDLERGRRNWTIDRIVEVETATTKQNRKHKV